MKQLFFLLYIILLIQPALFAQEAKPDTGSVKWLDFKEAHTQYLEKQKPIFIYIYNENCDSCKMMQDSTFRLAEVSDYINYKFYPVKLNAQTNDSIPFFDGKVYVKSSAFTYNPLVTQFLGEKPIFPSIVILNTDGYGAKFEGFRDRDHIFPPLVYTSENAYKSAIYEDFEKNYFIAYPPNNKRGYTVTRSIVKWKTFNDAMEACKKNPKKIFIDLYVNWNVCNTVMYLTTFNNPTIAKYLNDNFYCVHLDATTRDTLVYDSIKYINAGKAPSYHQLPYIMQNKEMIFPAIFILNEQMQPIEKKNTYYTPEDFEILIKYYGSNAYKTQNWDEYTKNFKSEIKQ